ncbi:type IV pilus biogenesis protein PilP [Pseudomonas putida]|uniref:type IV pilus biogenesis protein PilP n=1 Tax=Pseudomonas putida TaxID=303 RepID=UPI001F5175D7|nr:type IV pilus biogenesis protein PilP [Pseudomonas putida]MCI1021417.1 type IV pilus biogenesis protein PilP [Pseudomonas putida]
MRSNSVSLLIAGAFASNAFAAPSDLSAISIGELGKIQSETILLKAKAERAKAEREVNGEATVSPQTASSGLSNPFPISQPMQHLPPESKPASHVDLPVIKAITGTSQKMQAALLYSSGVEVDAFTGRELPGGYRVAQITLDGVTLESKGKRYPLGFSNQAPSAAIQPPALSQPASVLPGMLQTKP